MVQPKDSLLNVGVIPGVVSSSMSLIQRSNIHEFSEDLQSFCCCLKLEKYIFLIGLCILTDLPYIQGCVCELTGLMVW